MSHDAKTYLVTGANGQLGLLAVQSLIEKVPAAQVIALVRKPEAGADLAALGVTVRIGSYDDPASLDAAFVGVTHVLLISSSEVGQRLAQHENVIAAAKKAGVAFLAYTSILRADTSPLGLAVEHLATEKAIVASGIPYAFLRNSWYLENYLGSIGPALEHGAVAGSVGEGRISAASRADYAEAAAVVLANSDAYVNAVLELAGDDAFTLTDLAAAIGELAGKPVVYAYMPEDAYKAMLVQVGLPEGFAGLLADSDVGASKGGLFEDGKTLSRIIGRPTTPLKTVLAGAMGK
ncbi:SDR family oxidoreductase [Rhizobium sp. TRM95796]|uniref:SDR family oxidoreductase n=1 Tax=Rhizobium sp. TRM95796 TaxID=2979862 RepID=UPI0021E9056B|nr:SDR family oxidoreductase [Rhizobium sp. TRM95796]MCV3765065.1 SDR family oxidoreductase [Rhizobium sp. TRM95796]